MGRFTLSRKAFFVILIIVLPIALTFLHGYTRNREFLKTKILDEMTVVAEAYEGQVYLFLEMSKARAMDFAADGVIRERLVRVAPATGKAASSSESTCRRTSSPSKGPSTRSTS